MEHIHVALLFPSWDLIFWVIILIQYLCYRESSPHFCCALEVLHKVIFFHLYTRVSFWYASRSWGCSSYTLCSIALGEQSLHSSWCSTPTYGWYNDSCRGMSALLERAIIIIFSLHLGESLVLYLAMLSFISLPHTVLHQNFQFYLIAFILGW